jgi:hypothetical protein
MRIKHARKGFLVSMSRNEIRTLKLTLNLIDTEDFSRLHGYDDVHTIGVYREEKEQKKIRARELAKKYRLAKKTGDCNGNG